MSTAPASTDVRPEEPGSITPTAEELEAARQSRGVTPPASPEGFDAILAGVPEEHREAVRKAAEAATKERERSLHGDYTRKTQELAAKQREAAAVQQRWDELQSDPDFLELRARRARGTASPAVDLSTMPIEQAVPYIVEQRLKSALAPFEAKQEEIAAEIRRQELGRQVDGCVREFGDDFVKNVDKIDEIMDKLPVGTHPRIGYLVYKGQFSLENAQAELNRREQEKLATQARNRSVRPPSPGAPAVRPTGKVRSFADAYRLGLADKEAAS